MGRRRPRSGGTALVGERVAIFRSGRTCSVRSPSPLLTPLARSVVEARDPQERRRLTDLHSAASASAVPNGFRPAAGLSGGGRCGDRGGRGDACGGGRERRPRSPGRGNGATSWPLLRLTSGSDGPDARYRTDRRRPVRPERGPGGGGERVRRSVGPPRSPADAGGADGCRGKRAGSAAGSATSWSRSSAALVRRPGRSRPRQRAEWTRERLCPSTGPGGTRVPHGCSADGRHPRVRGPAGGGDGAVGRRCGSTLRRSSRRRGRQSTTVPGIPSRAPFDRRAPSRGDCPVNLVSWCDAAAATNGSATGPAFPLSSGATSRTTTGASDRECESGRGSGPAGGLSPADR